MRDCFFAALLLAVVALPAGACPVCGTGTGEAVRAEIVGDQLGVSVLATALPFAVVLGVAAVIHSGVPGARKKHGDRG